MACSLLPEAAKTKTKSKTKRDQNVKKTSWFGKFSETVNESRGKLITFESSGGQNVNKLM